MRFSFVLAVFIGVSYCAVGYAQTPGIIYTWAGTGNTRQWLGGSSANAATVTNSTPDQLTVVELGDPLEPFDPGLAHVIRDEDNRRLESSTDSGGLDLWGLESVEIDLAHNGSGNVNVQFFMQVSPEYNYVWAGSNGALNGPDFTLSPGMHTLQFPLSLLTPAQQSYIRVMGLSIRDHASVGNVTWNVFEVRSTGTSPPVRNLATHDVGSSDNGLNGVYANFDLGTPAMPTIIGSDSGQNQTGFTQNTSGTGSLQWTDRGGAGTPASPSGAAVTWGNGTVFDGNSFNERLADFSNYDTLTFRMSATDPLNAGGNLGVQAFFQTGNYTFQTTSGGVVLPSGAINLPIDGQYHDLVFPLANVTNRQNVQTFGMNLFAHMNNLIINVDLVQFNEVDEIPGDFNLDDKVDAADYVVWRKANGTPGDYSLWQQHFGEMAMPGSGGAVPEPATNTMLVCLIFGIFSRDRQRK